MFIVLVGGGKVGYHMTKELLDIGHEVVLIGEGRSPRPNANGGAR